MVCKASSDRFGAFLLPACSRWGVVEARRAEATRSRVRELLEILRECHTKFNSTSNCRVYTFCMMRFGTEPSLRRFTADFHSWPTSHRNVHCHECARSITFSSQIKSGPRSITLLRICHIRATLQASSANVPTIACSRSQFARSSCLFPSDALALYLDQLFETYTAV